MFIYITDGKSILSGPVNVPVVPGIGLQMPSNAVCLPKLLPPPAVDHVWVLREGKPTQLADHRGTVYRTDNGAEQLYDELGPLPARLTSLPCPSLNHRWDGDDWVYDGSLEAANRQALARRLCGDIDKAADTARQTMLGDPLRALEYERAAAEAADFQKAGYPDDKVPRTVAAWALNGRTARESADGIIAEAAIYTEVLYRIREVRLHGKEAVRKSIGANKLATAENIASDTVVTIARAAEWTGNNDK